MPDYHCAICEVNYRKDEIESFGCCQHFFCFHCLHLYLKFKIQRFADVQCPQGDCDEPIGKDKIFFEVLSPQEKKQFTKINNFYKTLKNPLLRLCPDEKCEEGVLKIKEGEKETQCDKCEKRFCSSCFFPSHTGPC